MYVQKLAELEPSNPQIRALIDDLRQRRGALESARGRRIVLLVKMRLASP